MIISLLYLLPAILGLSFLIFFHELGHYYMARRVGMRIETFAIGFGRPIYSWMKDGVKWQIGWLLFGGYVKIAGQDTDDKRDPYEISDGFFGKRPIDRIKVAFAGPFVNLVLALLIFAVIWAMGGREKNFAEFSHKIGWVDPKSELYADGVRPGDEITSYNEAPYQSFKDHLYAPMISSESLVVTGNKVDYLTGEKQPFEYTVKPYTHPQSLEKDRLTSGIINAANYVIYDKQSDGKKNELPEGSPMQISGIEYGDRIVWVDGNLIFSGPQMSYLLNDKHALLTIVRDGRTLLVRVPKVSIQELKLDNDFKEELMDWQYTAGLNGIKLQKLSMIPYSLTNDGTVEAPLKFIDQENELEAIPQHPYAANEMSLQAHDKIIAINGKSITSSYQLLAQLQQQVVNIIVERNPGLSKNESWQNADVAFDRDLNMAEIEKIANTIGTSHPIVKAGNYVLLNPVTPKTRLDFDLSPEKRAQLSTEWLEQKKEIEKIEDVEKRNHMLALLKNQENQVVLGLAVQDRHVNYDPSPFSQFKSVLTEIWSTLVALVTGELNPKWMSGPIGIVQVVHDNSMVGVKEALFWLGAISLNLGILNLLPIPVLDGGTIVLSLFEMVTGRKIRPKTLEKLILPFAVLLITFFVFLTYQDLSRIFSFIQFT